MGVSKTRDQFLWYSKIELAGVLKARIPKGRVAPEADTRITNKQKVHFANCRGIESTQSNPFSFVNMLN